MPRRSELIVVTLGVLAATISVLLIRLVGTLGAVDGEGWTVTAGLTLALGTIAVCVIGLGVFLGTSTLNDSRWD